MSDALIFVLIFAGFFVLRGIAATVVFGWIEIPEPSHDVSRGTSAAQPRNETSPAAAT